VPDGKRVGFCSWLVNPRARRRRVGTSLSPTIHGGLDGATPREAFQWNEAPQYLVHDRMPVSAKTCTASFAADRRRADAVGDATRTAGSIMPAAGSRRIPWCRPPTTGVGNDTVAPRI